MPARHVMQAAQARVGRLEMPATVAEYALVGPGRDHLAVVKSAVKLLLAVMLGVALPRAR